MGAIEGHGRVMDRQDDGSSELVTLSLQPRELVAEKGELVVGQGEVTVLRGDHSGPSSTLVYSPMIDTNGASSVKYTPGCVIVVRADRPGVR